MEGKTLQEGFSEVLEQMKNGELDEPIKGVTMVIGTTKNNFFEQVKEEISSENVLLAGKVNMNELEKILQENKEDLVVIEATIKETVEERMEQSITYGNLAKQYDKNILIHVELDESLDGKIIGISDFRKFTGLEQDAGVVVGINSLGQITCKNRFPNKNEPDLKKLFHIV